MESNILEWYCTEDFIQIFCNSNDDQLRTAVCHGQTLTPKSHKCYSNDAIITSVVEINISSYKTTWTCMDPSESSVNDSIQVAVKSEFLQCEYFTR